MLATLIRFCHDNQYLRIKFIRRGITHNKAADVHFGESGLFCSNPPNNVDFVYELTFGGKPTDVAVMTDEHSTG